MSAPTEASADRRRLESLAPHRGPMLLLDALVEHGEDHAVCSVEITDGARFVVDGQLPTVVTLEYMAQCIAVFAGLSSGTGPRVGYLVGVRELNLAVDALTVGDLLSVRIKRVWSSDISGSFAGQVERRGEVVADAKLSVYVPPEGAELP